MLFEDRVVWITGAGSGIGRALAHEMARQGADLALSGRRQDRLDQVQSEIEALGREALVLPLDVTDDTAVFAAADAVGNRFNGIDVVIANAGYGVAGRFERVTTEQWRRQFEVNVVGLTSTVRAALPFLKRNEGRIALLGSVASMIPMPGSIAYASSKYAVRAIGQTLSMELSGQGVSCTTLHPGFVESEIAQVDNEGEFHADRQDSRPQKFMWPADKAARVCVKAIHARKREFVFTGHGRFGAFIGRHMPGVAHFAMTRNKKKR